MGWLTLRLDSRASWHKQAYVPYSTIYDARTSGASQFSPRGPPATASGAAGERERKGAHCATCVHKTGREMVSTIPAVQLQWRASP
eukprot:1070107-Prymnesium_polylepis.1